MIAKTKPLENVAIIGTGTMGTLIALLAAHNDYKVMIYDSDKFAFKKAVDKFRKEDKTKNIKTFVPIDGWDYALQNIKEKRTLEEAVNKADLVIEAIPEKLNLKLEIIKKIGDSTTPYTIIASNSSSIPISRLETSSGHPENCLNIHFYLGAKMADIMGGSQTLPEVYEKGVKWIKSLSFYPLKVKKELLGFCYNRVWRAIKREVLYMWANDFVDFRDIDRASMLSSGGSSGPFGAMDAVGLDVIYDIEMVYYRESGDERDKPPKKLKEMVDKGELGVKTGKGFYIYPNPEFRDRDFLNPLK
jgi:3-hydroxybutyryl-CoA dehydrogenase